MVFYFTATGNSLYVAKAVAGHERPVSIAQAIHDREKAYRADSIGIVCPIFGHEMPELVKDFLKASRFETDCFYILLTYGNRHGGAAELAGLAAAEPRFVSVDPRWAPEQEAFAQRWEVPFSYVELPDKPDGAL